MDIVETAFQNLVEHYRGTCQVMEEDDFAWLEDNDLLQRWDDEIFLCDECGWYCGDDERFIDWEDDQPEELLCDECARDR